MRSEDADAGRSRNSTREHELSISALPEAGIAQIMIDSSAVRDAASFYRGRIMGGILRAETDALFRNRRRSELAKNATRRANRPRSDVMKGEPSPPELINRLARLALSLGGLEQRKMFQRIRGTSDERRRLTDACAP
jgi:hypothetical protein